MCVKDKQCALYSTRTSIKITKIGCVYFKCKQETYLCLIFVLDIMHAGVCTLYSDYGKDASSILGILYYYYYFKTYF